jgi:hypothetical protein
MCGECRAAEEPRDRMPSEWQTHRAEAIQTLVDIGNSELEAREFVEKIVKEHRDSATRKKS